MLAVYPCQESYHSRSRCGSQHGIDVQRLKGERAQPREHAVLPRSVDVRRAVVDAHGHNKHDDQRRSYSHSQPWQPAIEWFALVLVTKHLEEKGEEEGGRGGEAHTIRFCGGALDTLTYKKMYAFVWSSFINTLGEGSDVFDRSLKENEAR